MSIGQLTHLETGMKIPFGGDRFAVVDQALAESFTTGDRLYVVQDTGALLHVPSHVVHDVTHSVDAAVSAFDDLRSVPPSNIVDFYRQVATRLASAWDGIVAANNQDVARAEEQGRSTTRLLVNDQMRSDMIAGLEEWATLVEDNNSDPDFDLVERVDHGDWSVDVRTAALGVIGFVFEGRPNVIVDAAGVLATGNTAALRIGGDALGTATAIIDQVIAPSLAATGLPVGSLSLVPVRDRSAGWALFSDPRLALAVVRGSGAAVTQLGSIARQAGVPVSAHGTGGAWIVVDAPAETERVRAVISNSLDRKVCNTVNTVVVLEDNAQHIVPVVLSAADDAAAARGGVARVHIAQGTEKWVDATEFDRVIPVQRAEGVVDERRVTTIPVTDLGKEWEWENTPEISVVVVHDVAEAAELFNTYSPQFIASLLTTDPAKLVAFRDNVNAPFVGDGFTRWVDGQYTLNQPELGLSNWEKGRLLGRAAVLTGGDLTTRRMYSHHQDPSQHR